jgi:PleD family two-component response regulator
LSVFFWDGINGYETCKRLKQDERLKSIPIIFITTRKEDEDIAEGFEAGGSGF